MQVKRILAFVALTLLLVPAITFASQGEDREMINFRVTLTVPLSSANETNIGCQYATGAQNLWIRSSSGDTEIMVIFNGRSAAPPSSGCRFIESIPLDINSDQTFSFNKRELFTLTPEEMAGNNNVDIEFGPGGYSGYEIWSTGRVVAAEPTPTPDPETVFQLVAQIEGVTSAQEAYFPNSNSGTLFIEPWSFNVITYTFESEGDASDSFPAVCEFVTKQTRNVADGATPAEISVGRLGDETCAYLDGDSGNRLWIATRKGNHILTVFTLSAGGDTVEYTADWLENYLNSLTDNSDSLMPTLADLPRGWTQVGETEDVTDDVNP